jgi:hypothetical protein
MNFLKLDRASVRIEYMTSALGGVTVLDVRHATVQRKRRSVLREERRDTQFACDRRCRAFASPSSIARFAAMAATSVCAISALASAPPSVLKRTSFTGTAVQGLPVLRVSQRPSSLRVEARTRKVIPREPLGESVVG